MKAARAAIAAHYRAVGIAVAAAGAAALAGALSRRRWTRHPAPVRVAGMSSPVRVEESVGIARPATEVWDAVSDYAFDLQWRNGLVEMTPDPPGPAAAGTKVHEVVRSSSRAFVADTVVTELDPGVSYRFAGTGTIGAVSGGRSVRPDPRGTGAVFTYAIELQPTGRMRVLRPVLGRLVRSGLKKDLQKLKALLVQNPG